MSDLTCTNCGEYVGSPIADRIEELEVKLSRAVEALTDIVKDCEAEYPPSHGAIKYFCRTTLSELKGETDA